MLIPSDMIRVVSIAKEGARFHFRAVGNNTESIDSNIDCNEAAGVPLVKPWCAKGKNLAVVGGGHSVKRFLA